MKNGTKLLIVLLMLFSLACGGARPTDTPDAPMATAEIDGGTVEVEDGTVEPTDGTVEPTDGTVEPTDGAPSKLSLNPQALDELTSYRGQITTRFDDQQGLSEEVTMEILATRNPRAQQLSAVMGEETFSYIVIEDEYWIGFDDQWSQINLDDSEDMLGGFDDFLLDQEELLAGIDDTNYEYIGREVVNGINTHHYRLEYDSMTDLTMGMEVEEIRSAEADIWVADESGLPEMMVRFILKVEATTESEEGNFTITFDILDVNDPTIVIEAPESASGGLPEGVPEYPGAIDFMGFGGMMTFATEDDLATVHGFYTERLNDNGWERSDSMDLDDLVMETWERDGQSFQLTISVEDDGTTSVFIIVGE